MRVGGKWCVEVKRKRTTEGKETARPSGATHTRPLITRDFESLNASSNLAVSSSHPVTLFATLISEFSTSYP